MEEFNAYIKNIAAFTMLMVFADIIMPDRFSKKYVNFIMGIVLAVTAMGPAIRLINKGFNTEIIMENVQNRILEEDAQEYSDIIFKSVFEENLAWDMENELTREGIIFEDISVFVKEDESGNYILEKVNLSADDENFETAKEIINEKYAPKETTRN